MSRGASSAAATPSRRPRGGAAGRGRSGGGASPFWRGVVVSRWGRAVLLALAVLLLVPVVHALSGDVGVLLFGGIGLGFLLGRWTGKRQGR
jgi:hypothetical protein